MRCAYGCHEIGGPWIAENPDCPVHGAEGHRQEEEVVAERAATEDRIQELEAAVEALNGKLEAVKDELHRMSRKNATVPRLGG